MGEIFAFVAYPSEPADLCLTIEAGIQGCLERRPEKALLSWSGNDIAGRFLVGPVLENIRKSLCLVADITVLNFNVTYEIGFAIGLQKRVFLVRNRSVAKNDAEMRHVGIFDTLGYKEYENSIGFQSLLQTFGDLSPLGLMSPDKRTPVFILQFPFNTDVQNRLISRVKKSRYRFKNYDPVEQSRLSAGDAIRGVSSAYGVIIPLARGSMVDARVHNLRAAFLAGLAHGLERVTLLLQEGDDPVPLDYRDFVQSFKHPNGIDELINQFALDVTDAIQSETKTIAGTKTGLLAGLDLGATTAENEFASLHSYYLQTDEYQKTLRGEARIVVGRKGAGKTAVFAQVRDRLRRNKMVIVLDLRPEGYQLTKFKTLILRNLDAGTQEHTINAFWEYVLLLEIAYKILEKDRSLYLRDHEILEPYRQLETAYSSDDLSQEGDFSERMLRLIERISLEFEKRHGKGENFSLSRSDVTNFLYAHDLRTLRTRVANYLKKKDGVRILFDNLDKGWATNGVTTQDLLIVRCLLEASRKIEQSFRSMAIACNTTVFIRNDVYTLLVSGTPDKGKESIVSLDWSEPDMLREMLLKRIQFNGVAVGASFDDAWRLICVSHVHGEESSQYLIERSLMRPRFLLDLIGHCKSSAINLGRRRIEQADIDKGLSAYSTDLIYGIDYEIRDVLPNAEDVLYLFLGLPFRLRSEQLSALLMARYDRILADEITDILIWYGVLGILRLSGEVAYIYSVNYDIKRMKAIMSTMSEQEKIFQINPAFWAGLEIQSVPSSLHSACD